MKMNENEWKREHGIEIAEEVYTKRYMKHLIDLRALLHVSEVQTDSAMRVELCTFFA